MTEITIGSRMYNLTDKPLRKDVVRVRRLQKSMLYELIDLTKIQTGSKKELAHMDVGVLIQEQIIGDPKKLAAFTEIDQEIRTTGTIVLCTGMTEEEVLALPNQDFLELLAKCKEILGGDAQDFLKASEDSMFLMPTATTATQTTSSGSGTSPHVNQQENSSETQKTGPGGGE